MISFLDQVADHLVQTHSSTQLSGMALVVPSRRAAYFLKQALANRAKGPVLSPAILAMDDFMQQTSRMDRADTIELLFDLFEVFQTIHSEIVLEKFMGWGPILLKDFDLIDQYGVEDPERLFAYVSEAKALERWGLKPGEAATQAQQNYFSLYEQIRQSYHAFSAKLQAKGRVYRGLAYRKATENVVLQPQESTPYHFHYFIGLNALSKTEEQLIQTLLKEKLADCLWDADALYVKGGHRAGLFLRRHQKNLMAGKPWKWMGQALTQEPKQVNFIPVNAAIWQPQIAAQRYESAGMDGVKNGVGWILNDESLLPAVLQSLPQGAESVNITMGLSLRQSASYAFLSSILTLQLHARTVHTSTGVKRIPTFTPSLCRDVYQNPLYAQYRRMQNIPEELALRYLDNSPKIDPTEWLTLVGEDPLGQLVFSRWPNSIQSLTWVNDVLHTLRGAFVGDQQVMEVEFLFTLLTVCQRLQRAIPTHQPVSLGLIRQLLVEVVRQERVPFAGEPVAELQIMSMLETRCLDFQRVAIFHTNEGFLPSAKKVDSLIPIDLAREYGLPIYSDQDSVMAYHFFRLLQRAEVVDIYYIQPSGKGLGGGKEPSRFLRQLDQWDLPHWTKKTLVIQQPIDLVSTHVLDDIHKTADLIGQWKNWLSTKGLTPTSLDVWLRCQRKFVFQYLWNWKEIREDDETMGADVFGQLIHRVLELFYAQFPIQNAETAGQFKKMLPEVMDRLLLEYPYSQFDFGGGYHALIRKIAESQVDVYLNHLVRENTEHVVESMEFTLKYTLELAGQVDVRLSARVDQREQVGDKAYLIDFKTGAVDTREFGKDLFASIAIPKSAKVRQLWLYQYLLLKMEGNADVFAKIVSLRDINTAVELQPISRWGSVASFIDSSEQFLNGVIHEMLNADYQVQPTNDVEQCKFCGFKLGCGKSKAT